MVCLIELTAFNSAHETFMGFYRGICSPPIPHEDDEKESNHDDDEHIVDIDGVKEVKNEGNVNFHYTIYIYASA